MCNGIIHQVPYTYTLARDAYDTGLGPLRPMYYEYPTFSNAYNADMTGKQGQYLYGNDMVVSPVTSPSAPNSSFLAPKTWWVPPGTWVEENSHQVYTGNADGTTMVDMLYALHETPVLVRAGAIITTLPSVLGDTIGVASRQYTSLIHTIYPGAKQGRSVVYEDDGRTTSYAAAPSTPSTTSATTTTTYTRDGDVMTVAISTVGTFPELPTLRASTFLHVVGGGPSKLHPWFGGGSVVGTCVICVCVPAVESVVVRSVVDLLKLLAPFLCLNG